MRDQVVFAALLYYLTYHHSSHDEFTSCDWQHLRTQVRDRSPLLGPQVGNSNSSAWLHYLAKLFGETHIKQMGKQPWHCTIKSLNNSIEFWMEKILSISAHTKSQGISSHDSYVILQQYSHFSITRSTYLMNLSMNLIWTKLQFAYDELSNNFLKLRVRRLLVMHCYDSRSWYYCKQNHITAYFKTEFGSF